jgi:hypothetical protein
MPMMISQPRDRSNPTWENPSMSPKTGGHYDEWSGQSLVFLCRLPFSSLSREIVLPV